MTRQEKMRGYVRKSLSKRRERLKAAGLCVDCGKAKVRETSKTQRVATLCSACTDIHSKRNRGAYVPRKRVGKKPVVRITVSDTAQVERMMYLATGKR